MFEIYMGRFMYLCNLDYNIKVKIQIEVLFDIISPFEKLMPYAVCYFKIKVYNKL